MNPAKRPKAQPPRFVARAKQKVVSSEGAEELIAQGWKFIGVLSNGKVVVGK